MWDGNGYMPETVQEPVERVDRLVFWVAGVPVPQGSKVAGVTKDGRAYVRDVSARDLNAWRREVEQEADRMLAGRDGLLGAVAVGLKFEMPRPKTVTRGRPSVKPDADKLARAVLDALTKAAVYEDDARVVDLHVSEWYADDQPGVWITVEAAA